MRIGIDFDNTIACYDSVFVRVAASLGMLDDAAAADKAAVKAALMATRDDWERDWMRLQGQVYGAFMAEATPYPGFLAFLERAAAARAEVMIISHKTEYGHFDTARINLRDAARAWLETCRIAGGQGCAIDADQVFFEASRGDKVARVAACRCSHFIDDLPEVLAQPGFPQATRRILFAPGGTGADVPVGVSVAPSWHAIGDELFDAG